MISSIATISSLFLISYFPVDAWVPSTAFSKNIYRDVYTTCRMVTVKGGKRNGKSKKTQGDLLDFINKPMEETVDESRTDPGPPSADSLSPIVRTIVKAADKRKAEGIAAIRVSKITAVTGFMIFAIGNSRPQNTAIAAAIKEDMEEEYGEMYQIRGNGVPEGSADSGWIVLDYGDVMVHVMTPKSALFYDLEGQWREKGGEYMDLTEILLPNKMGDTGIPALAEQTDSAMNGIDEEDDPFWS